MMARTAAAENWLKLDAKNRAWRVMLKGFVVIVLLPGLDAILQVLVNSLRAGGEFDWERTATVAAIDAITAVSIAALAYVHRLVVDPSAIPSALPPRPPGATAAEAPLTDPATAQPRHTLADTRTRWPESPEKGD